jgi:hypothetical protein
MVPVNNAWDSNMAKGLAVDAGEPETAPRSPTGSVTGSPAPGRVVGGSVRLGWVG